MPRLSKIGAACLAAFGYTQGTSTVAANTLVVAGGAGGGGNNTGGQGGGGAGGLLQNIVTLNYELTYTIIVGAGGAGATSNIAGVNGSNSSFSALGTVAIGGGGGGAGATPVNGQNGGSGGGAAYQGTSGAGTSGQGNAGGTGLITGAGNSQGGGGGGSSAIGGNASSNTAGNGGNGTASSITGSSVTYAGGGGGGNQNQTLGGVGGLGGGGNGAKVSTNPVAGAANLGAGGGGGGGAASGVGAAGGSGVVIISYASPTQIFGGGIVTYSGGNWIHTFRTSGTLVPISTFNATLLAIAGGASGGAGSGGHGCGGGGGAGEYYSSVANAITIDVNSNYIVTIGAGGAGVAGPGGTAVGSDGNNGSNTIVLAYTVKGGGFGSGAHPLANGGTGGSGGGAGGSATSNGIGGSASPFIGVGFAGGSASTQYDSRGGGGSGSTTTTTAGGNGTSSSISGTAVSYAGGGGGAINTGAGGAGQAGGGNGGSSGAAGGAAIANSGSGGGGGGNTGTGAASGNGGSGIVIISYAGAQRMAGGTVTFVGGNTIHTFTSSGYLSALKLVDRSLRFKASTSSYLNRTFGTPTNANIWTWSGWIKRGILGGNVSLIGVVNGSGDTNNIVVRILSDQFSMVGGTTSWRVSTQVFRDPAAWYHFVISVDTTQSTANNRILIYVNGVQITAFGTLNNPTQSTPIAINTSSAPTQIGAYNTANFFDGYMTEINFVDGQALTPSSFGGYNSFGVWQPCQYLGSYGNNGFYLPFTNNTSSTTIGYDFSPNQNNWTANGFTLTPTTSVNYDSMTDVPTLTSATASNWCVMNPLKTGVNLTPQHANLLALMQSNAGGLNQSVTGTIYVSSGKWYWEGTSYNTVAGYGQLIGIASDTFTALNALSGSTGQTYGYEKSGTANNGATAISYGTTYTSNDVIGIALDLDAGTLVFYKNGVSQGTAFTGISGNFTPFCGLTYNGGGPGFYMNFGQRPFAQTPPTGFVALNTFNM